MTLWRTRSFPRRSMRSAFRPPGVPPTREAETASSFGGALNRPMRAGFAENSFLINVEAPLLLVVDEVAQDTDALDLHFEDIAGLHVDRRLACRPNATGCSGDDQVARLQTHR